MSEKDKDDLYYVCSLIEYIARKTKNHRNYVVNQIGKAGIKKQLYLAQVNHCLSFEQVSDELIEEYKIENGDYDTVKECLYDVPSFLSIGNNYKYLILSINSKDVVDTLIKVFNSLISDNMSNFNTDFFYQNPSYHKACYLANEVLD